MNHDKHKRNLKVLGIILTSISGLCAIIGLADFFRAFNSMEQPKLFFLLFLGLPGLGFGINLIRMGYLKEVHRYVVNETKDTTFDFTKDLSKAVVKGINEGKEETGIYCKHCGALNDSDAKFCKKCGKEI